MKCCSINKITMGFTDSDAVYGTKLKTQGAIKEFEEKNN